MTTPSKLAVKMVAEEGDTFTVGGYGVVWGGQDVEGERFTKATDFWFDRLTETPMVLYRHGLESAMQREVVGRVIKKLPDDVGLWIEAQIKDHENYSTAIRKLVKKGVLGWSSGAVNHLVDKVRTGGVTEIRSWPIAEWSLVPDPCEPRTIGVSEIKSLSPELADTIKAMTEASDAGGGFVANGKPDSKADASSGYDTTDNSVGASGRGDFAYVDSAGRGHLPVHDAGHVRAALSRFNQTHFESPAKKKTAARKIIARAHALNIDVADDSAVSQAAKVAPPVKDLPDGPTMMADADDSGPYPEGSYEDLADDIRQACQRMMSCYCYVTATFPGYALVCCATDDEGTQYLRVAYELDDSGEPILGSMEKVTPAMIPLPVNQTDEAPLAIQSARLEEHAALLVSRTKDVSERRVKEGRILSTSNRDRLVSTADALDVSLKALRDLLSATEPQSAEAASVDTASAKALRRRAREIAALELYAETMLDCIA